MWKIRGSAPQSSGCFEIQLCSSRTSPLTPSRSLKGFCSPVRRLSRKHYNPLMSVGLGPCAGAARRGCSPRSTPRSRQRVFWPFFYEWGFYYSTQGSHQHAKNGPTYSHGKKLYYFNVAELNQVLREWRFARRSVTCSADKSALRTTRSKTRSCSEDKDALGAHRPARAWATSCLAQAMMSLVRDLGVR